MSQDATNEATVEATESAADSPATISETISITGPSEKRPAPISRRSHRAKPSDPLAFVTEGLEEGWTDYVSCLYRFLQSSSGRNVHNLRVAIRRLSTVFDLIDRLDPDNTARRARVKLRRQLSALSSLRDTHVEMVRVRGFLKQVPELKGFYDELKEREDQQRRVVQKIDWKGDRKFTQIAVNRSSLRLNARRMTSSTESARKVIEATIDALFDNLSRRLAHVSAADYESIHRVRLAFRPIRYTLEVVQPLLGLDPSQVRRAADLARIMGNIQDLQILMKHIVEYNWKKEKQLGGTLQVWLGLERQKTGATSRFLRAMPKFGKIVKPIIYDQRKTSTAYPRTLLVLRHGIAVTRGDPGYPLDSERPLTSKGIKRVHRIATSMRRMHVDFDVVVSSPIKRALETAFIVARNYEAGQLVQTIPALKPEVLPEAVVRALIENYSSCRRILLVGHEPQLSALISTLTAGSASARPILKKGGLCRLQVNKLQVGKCATLLWLLTPRQLMATG